jgi:hypothetical protein
MRKQCLKICDYLQRVRHLEILRMRAEFLLDDNQSIWLTFVGEIQMRRIRQSKEPIFVQSTSKYDQAV